MFNFLGVFFPSLISVFLLGFQSRLVNTGNYIGAGICSFTIAMFQASVWHSLMAPNATWETTLAYGIGGSLGIMSAIYAHKRFFPKAING
jgi:O-antigen ligase